MKKLCILFITALLFSCKKEVCFKCRDYDVPTIYVKGTDTIITYNRDMNLDLQNLIDSGYTKHVTSIVWFNYYVTICNDNGIKTIDRDSCTRL